MHNTSHHFLIGKQVTETPLIAKCYNNSNCYISTLQRNRLSYLFDARFRVGNFAYLCVFFEDDLQKLMHPSAEG